LPGKHSGTPATPRNRAILQGEAPFIAFLDDDDLWVPEKLERQMEFLKRHPGCVLLGSNAYCWPGGTKWHRSLPLYFQKAPFGLIDYHTFVQDDYFINSSVIILRKVLERSGLQNETLFSGPSAEDYEFWLRIGVLGETWLMPEPLIVYREAPALNVRHRSKEDRQRSYRTKAKTYASALKGVENILSPLSYPENERYAKACRFERDFYLAGPRFLGRLKHNLAVFVKKYFFASR
jgi:glycosyltransferase involved in cell wall biosynthesis